MNGLIQNIICINGTNTLSYFMGSNKYSRNERFSLTILSIVLILLFIIVITGCKSIPLLDTEHACKHVTLAGQPWQEPTTGLIMSFNDDCTAMIQQCQSYLTYAVIDDNNISMIVDNSDLSAVAVGIRAGCPNVKDQYKCSYTLTRLLDIHEEVLDIKCNWNDELMQLTRAGN